MGFERNDFRGPRPLTVAELRSHLQALELSGHGNTFVYHGGDGTSPALAVAGGAVGPIDGVVGLFLAPVPLKDNGGF